jgi:hypothetical protein
MHTRNPRRSMRIGAGSTIADVWRVGMSRSLVRALGLRGVAGRDWENTITTRYNGNRLSISSVYLDNDFKGFVA